MEKKTSVYSINKQRKILQPGGKNLKKIKWPSKIQWTSSKRRPINSFNRPLSLGGHVESQENKKLCFRTASLALISRLGEACRAKRKLFILLRFNMAAE